MSGIVGGAGAKSGIIGQTELEYEVGDWTPQDTDGGGSSQAGKYTKIGKTVMAHFVFVTGSISGSDGFAVKNFPFTCGSTDAHRGAIAIGYTNADSFPGQGIINNGATTGYLMYSSGNAATDAQIGASKTITGTVVYRVN